MGPGPSDVAPEVLAAQARPTVGHLDPWFLEVMDQVRGMLRVAFGTENELTLPMSGTGSAGMETCIVNAVSPGDRVLVGVNGVFGGRMVELARRAGAEVVAATAPWGRAFAPEDLRRAANGGRFDVICVVHAETSTGVSQPLDGLRGLADACGALLLIDAVTSLGGMPVELDRHGVDLAYSGTQKCLSAPPGLAPVSLSARAGERLSARTAPVQSWYLDLSLIRNYWGGPRAYHHTAPVNQIYALHEALRLALEEGLPARFARHRRLGGALQAGLEAMGLELVVPPAERLTQLTAVHIPAGVSDKAVRGRLLSEFGLEIGGGLGDLAGRAWRIGLMGAACTRRNVTLCLSALSSALRAEGFTPRADPLAAADAAL